MTREGPRPPHSTARARSCDPDLRDGPLRCTTRQFRPFRAGGANGPLGLHDPRTLRAHDANPHGSRPLSINGQHTNLVPARLANCCRGSGGIFSFVRAEESGPRWSVFGIHGGFSTATRIAAAGRDRKGPGARIGARAFRIGLPSRRSLSVRTFTTSTATAEEYSVRPNRGDNTVFLWTTPHKSFFRVKGLAPSPSIGAAGRRTCAKYSHNSIKMQKSPIFPTSKLSIWNSRTHPLPGSDQPFNLNLHPPPSTSPEPNRHNSPINRQKRLASLAGSQGANRRLFHPQHARHSE